MQPNSTKKQLRIQINDSIDKTFKEYAKTISESIQKLSSFTDNLEGKVNTLLKAQQTEFVTSYKNHMSKIKQELAEMNNKLHQYQQKIQFYENEGRLSHYIKKVKFMEVQQIKLFDQVAFKDKKIKDLQFQIQMLKRLQKDSEEKIKIMYRKRIEDQQIKQTLTEKSFFKKQNSQAYLELSPTNKHMSSIETFTTEIPSYHYNRRLKLKNSHSKERQMTKLNTDDEERSMVYKSHDYTGNIGEGQIHIVKQNDLKCVKMAALEKEISHLKVQNKKLLQFNSKYASNLSELGEFFKKTVEELKKNISAKRKIKSDISFEDFCQQDKLVLIATLLSNEAALMNMYDQIFKPRPNKKIRAQSVLEKSYGSIKQPESLKTQRKIQEILVNPETNMPYVGKSVFPSIKSKRLIF